MSLLSAARHRDLSEDLDDSIPELAAPVAGKRSLTQRLPSRRTDAWRPAASPSGPTTAPADAALHAHLTASFAPHATAAPIQRKSVAAALGQDAVASPDAAPPTGAGAPLPDAVRAKMERALGADFSAVRVHEGPHVTAAGALAYAQGTELHFAPGQYRPESQDGQELLGHELAHVVQQAQGRASVAQAKLGVLDDDALEAEADQAGARAARAEPAADATSAKAETAPSSLAGIPAAAPSDVAPVQRVRAVIGAVDVAAVVRAHQSGYWMIVQGLAEIGAPQWHLSIFPCNQEEWDGTYKLPANDKRRVAKFMRYNEFHLTSPQGKHFFYSDTCVPVAESVSGVGSSPDWTKKDAWAAANKICAVYFGVDGNWLDEYVESQVKQQQDAKVEQDHQDRMFRYYSSYVAQHPEWYAKTQQTFEDWLAQLESGFQGNHQEFIAHMRQENKDRGGKPPIFAKRQWKDDEDGFGYVD